MWGFPGTETSLLVCMLVASRSHMSTCLQGPSLALLYGLADCTGQACFLQGPLKIGLSWGRGGQRGCLLFGSTCQCLSASEQPTHHMAECHQVSNDCSSPVCFGDGVRPQSKLNTPWDMNRRHYSQSTSTSSIQKGIFRETIIKYITGRESSHPESNAIKPKMPFPKGPEWPARKPAFPFMCKRYNGEKQKERKLKFDMPGILPGAVTNIIY